MYASESFIVSITPPVMLQRSTRSLSIWRLIPVARFQSWLTGTLSYARAWLPCCT